MTVVHWKSRHPDRAARAIQRRNAALAEKVAGGRAGKDALMILARSVASSGECGGWTEVLARLEQDGHDTALLRIWSGERDRDEIDRLCRRVRRPGIGLASSSFRRTARTPTPKQG